MDAFIAFFAWSTLGLPVFGVLVLLVAVMVSAAVYGKRKQGAYTGAGYPKSLFLIAFGLIFIPLLYFLFFVSLPVALESTP